MLEKLNLLNGTQTPCSNNLIPDVHNKIKEVAEEDELSDSFKTDSDFAASSDMISQQNTSNNEALSHKMGQPMAMPLPVQLQLPRNVDLLSISELTSNKLSSNQSDALKEFISNSKS